MVASHAGDLSWVCWHTVTDFLNQADATTGLSITEATGRRWPARLSTLVPDHVSWAAHASNAT